MPITLPDNARGPILSLTLPPSSKPIKLRLYNATTERKLHINLPEGWPGGGLLLDFERRTITDQLGADRSALLDPVDNELWLPDPLLPGANDVVIEAISTEIKTLGPVGPSEASNVATVGTQAWLNPNNAKASDNARATVALGISQVSHYLLLAKPAVGAPTGRLVGVEVAIERKASGPSSIADSTISLFKAGAPIGANLAKPEKWPSSDAVATYGGPSDLWGAALVSADVPNLGIGISAKYQGGVVSAEVDNALFTFYYTPPYGATAKLHWEKGYY